MKKIYITIFYLAVCTLAFAQNVSEKETAAIVEEGKHLYQLEMAAWYGTDIFHEEFSKRKDNIGGYITYLENNTSKCIFFSKGNKPKVIGSVTFKKPYSGADAVVDSTIRNFTANEKDIYTIRKTALAKLNSDTLFKEFKNTRLNLVPIVTKTEKKVYVLSAPQNNGVVIIGNDYVLSFDKNNKFMKTKQLHKDMVTIKFDEGKEDHVSSHTHSHGTSDYITATDICTLLLYESFAHWKQHIVISDNYVCSWDSKTDHLVTMTKKEWESKSKHSEDKK